MNRRKKCLIQAVFVFMMLILCGCSGNRRSAAENQNQNALQQQQTEEDLGYDTTFTGVVKECDTEKKTITLYDIKGQMEYVFDYTGGTDVKDNYDKIISMSQITIGEIVDVYYYEASQKLTALNISKDAWTYKGVGNLVADKTNKRMKISEHNYWYDDGLLLYSEGEPIQLIDLHERDVLTVKGVASQICSIVVTTGHGYIRLENYKDFIGGTIEVGYGIIVPIVDDMLIVAKEGEYKVLLENGELTAEENIKLKRDEEITLDLSGYKMPEGRIGYVRFDIEPYGADLTINGKQVDYSEPIKMNYGKHSIKVSMNGYDDFNGILTIGESTPTISIRLAEGTYEVEGDDTENSSEENKDSNTTIEEAEETDSEDEKEESEDNTVAGTTSVDKDHTITIESPAGATVYFNGTKMGTIPLSFTKEVGNHIIVLSRSGYATKSYSVEVLDDGDNAVFNFPDMIVESN